MLKSALIPGKSYRTSRGILLYFSPYLGCCSWCQDKTSVFLTHSQNIQTPVIWDANYRNVLVEYRWSQILELQFNLCWIYNGSIYELISGSEL